MKHVAWVALLLVVGCRASAAKRPAEAAAEKPGPAASGLSLEVARARAQLAQVDADLANIEAERVELAAERTSQAKSNRLVELATIEKQTAERKKQLTSRIADLEKRAAAGQKSLSADEALDLALEAGTEEADLRKAGEARRLERERLDREGGIGDGGGVADGRLFEERCAEAILRVKAELAKRAAR